MIAERDLIFSVYDDVPNVPDINFSEIIRLLVDKKQISGLVIKEPYHSISDIDRLNLMREYLKPKKIILIDRDGTLSIEFGAYGVPETFIIDKKKRIIKKFTGPINQEIVKEIGLIIK